MRTFRFGLILGCMLGTALFAAPQSGGPRETISLGVTNLILGMSEDAVVTKLASSYNLSKSPVVPPPLRAKGITSMWLVNSKVKGEGSGIIEFASGRLSFASKDLPTDDEVEFGRQIYFAMRDLEQEGDSHCTIETDNLDGPDFANKTATLRCGKKSLVIQVQKSKEYPETVGLAEALETVSHTKQTR